MSEHVESRYFETVNKELIIDISLDNYDELFNKWDSSASYLKKDLDSELVDFLYHCFEEVKNKPLTIRISVPKKDDTKQINLKKVIKNYFEYASNKEKIKLKQHISRTGLYLVLGLLFILFSTVLRGIAGINEIVKEVLLQGIIIIGWVTLWQVGTGVLYEFGEMRSKINTYQRIANAKIIFENK